MVSFFIFFNTCHGYLLLPVGNLLQCNTRFLPARLTCGTARFKSIVYWRSNLHPLPYMVRIFVAKHSKNVCTTPAMGQLPSGWPAPLRPLLLSPFPLAAPAYFLVNQYIEAVRPGCSFLWGHFAGHTIPKNALHCKSG